MRTKQLINLISLTTAVVATKQLAMEVNGPSTVNSTGDLKFTTIVTNNGDETLRILNDPNSAMSNFSAEKFTIMDPSGSRPSFTGARVKYVPAIAMSKNAFTTLEPQQSVTIEHDLSDAYAFNNEDENAYTFHAERTFTLVNNDSSLSKLTATVTPHTAVVSGGLFKTPKRKIERRAQFLGCSADQESTINAAIIAATDYAFNGMQYAVNDPSDSTGDRYTTWFGRDEPERHMVVESTLINLANNDLTDFTYDCSTCTIPDLFAYVYPDLFGTIYLCPVFWMVDTTGANSQGGTIVREASHFHINGGTQDHEYGLDDCMELAQTSPWKAISNADSYEFFVENVPLLN